METQDTHKEMSGGPTGRMLLFTMAFGSEVCRWT